MTVKPTTNGDNGRNSKGQFTQGWSGGPGRPRGTQSHYRQLMVASVSDKKFVELVDKVIECAQKGEPWALKELLDRLLGKSTQPIEGAIGVYGIEPSEEDVAHAAEIIGRRLKYGQAPTAN